MKNSVQSHIQIAQTGCLHKINQMLHPKSTELERYEVPRKNMPLHMYYIRKHREHRMYALYILLSLRKTRALSTSWHLAANTDNVHLHFFIQSLLHQSFIFLIA